MKSINKMKTLKLKKMGCDFWSDDSIKSYSDLENFRLRLEFIDKEKNYVMGDIGRGQKYRFTQKNGKILKKYIKVHQHKLYCDFQITKKDGMTYGYKTKIINDYIQENDLNYNSKDLLKLINYLSSDTYENIEIIK